MKKNFFKKLCVPLVTLCMLWIISLPVPNSDFVILKDLPHVWIFMWSLSAIIVSVTGIISLCWVWPCNPVATLPISVVESLHECKEIMSLLKLSKCCLRMEGYLSKSALEWMVLREGKGNTQWNGWPWVAFLLSLPELGYLTGAGCSFRENTLSVCWRTEKERVACRVQLEYNRLVCLSYRLRNSDDFSGVSWCAQRLKKEKPLMDEAGSSRVIPLWVWRIDPS